MFTGIVEELAQIRSIKPRKKGIRYSISADVVMDDIKIGDSISVNGVCLTIVETKKKYFCMDLVEETLNKSNLGELMEGDVVNLERAMKATDRFGGHIVQGHVETMGVILEKQKQGEEAILSVGLNPEWLRYCIPKGSITLDGVSLTIAKINGNIIEVALIPHTLDNTTLGVKDKSDTLNIETDIIGKYIDRLLSFDAEATEIDTNILKAIRNIQYGES
jgi:riboflavin synthase